MKTHELLLLVFILAGCGPGVSDGEFPISKGYAFFDPGGDGTMITYTKGKGSVEVVIDPRVDSYIVDENKIIIARHPLEAVDRGEVTDWKLLPTCEYWAIDTETHAVGKISDVSKWPKVQCH